MSLRAPLRIRPLTIPGIALGLVFLLAPGVILAQEEKPPKADIFVGYQWLNPGGTVPVGTNAQGTPIGGGKLPSIAQGVGGALGINFNKYLALEADYGGSWDKAANESTATIGPRLMWRGEGVNMFIHTLGGLNRLTVKGLPSKNGLGFILGGGIDLKLVRALSLRLFEADYVMGRFNYAEIVPPQNTALRRPVLEGVRLRTGLLFNLGGGAPPAPVAASCTVKPNEVMVGEPITATVTTSNFDPKHTLTYNWSTTGGKVTGKDTTASVDTNGVAGGNYTVTARVTDPKMKKGGEASCTANFTVKEPPKNPPTMSCTANPTTVQPGGTATITCTCTSPDNVAVNVSGWTASGGSIAGSGNTGTLNTTGAAPGTVTVNATCSDSRGLNATSSAAVNVEAPPPPPPQANKLSSCDFPNKVKPWRVDNTCKAVLDDVATRLLHDPETRLVVVGNQDPTEKRKNLAAERAVDSKAYLSGGEAKQSIDPSRIEVRSGSGGTKTADYWIVPPGATFNGEGTGPVNESLIKPIPDHPARPAGRKPAAKPKAQ
ncbi:MAG TPA: hypothetical protein VFJ47_13945 [Terriglobales bacterium]|nr:hypothetical protein [Terriglobales bacterium]